MTLGLDHKGNATKTQLTAQLGGTTSDLTVTVDDATGWPDGADGKFYGILNRTGSNPETILFSSRTGNVLTVWSSGMSTGRASADTNISVHDIGEYLEHIWTSVEASAVTDHVDATADVHGADGDVVGTNDLTTALAAYVPKSLIDAKGDIIVGSADDTPAILSIGAEGQVPTVNASGTLEYATPDVPGLEFVKAYDCTSGVTSQSLDADSFDSSHDVYVVQFVGKNGASTVPTRVNMRASGADDTEAEYDWIVLSNGAVADSGTGGTYGQAGTMLSADQNSIEVRFTNPAAAQKTIIESTQVVITAPPAVVEYGSVHTQAAAYDAATFSWGGQTFTGWIVLYRMRKS